jgi:hypothetical protein
MSAVPGTIGAAGHHRRGAAARPKSLNRRPDFLLRSKCQAGVLLVTLPVIVQIIGAPVACADGVKDAWREVAALVGDQLGRRFGETVQVEYFDLFDPTCPPVSPGSQLPLVLINGELFSSGGKISVPAIRKRLEVSGGIQA